MTSLRPAASSANSALTDAAEPPSAAPRPGASVTAVALLTAAAALGFAAINVVFETTGHILHTPGARIIEPEFAQSVGIAIADWLVAAVKVIGAAVVLLSLARHPALVGPRVLAGLLWAGFSTLGIYAAGNVFETVGMVAGVTGRLAQIGLFDISYVLFFLLFAAGFGVVAVSYLRRFRVGRAVALLGASAGPVAIGLLLAVLPSILNAFDLLPSL